MSGADREWRRTLGDIIAYGERRMDRTGVGTVALFGMHARFDLRDGFPAVTLKKLPFRMVCAELAAFIHGADSLADFNRLGCNWWDGNASAPAWKERQRFPGDVGRIYGVQWRRWRAVHAEFGAYQVTSVDQLKNLVDGLRADPHGRRHLVTAWNPGELDQMCLPPCHVGFQCFASNDGPLRWLDLGVHLRSLDVFLGMPCDVATYALLLHLIAREVGRAPRFLLMTSGDTHVYLNHFAQAQIAMAREPRASPRLSLSDGARLFDFLPENAALEGYDPHPAVPAPLNV